MTLAQGRRVGIWLAAAALAAMLMDAGAASAQTAHSCPTNGCGPDGFFGMLVPNEVAGCRFKPACDAHDVCYAKCLPCHPFSDSPACYGLDNKRARRTECDDSFRKQLTADNPGSRICALAAEAYYRAVRALGDTYHRGTPPTPDNTADFKRVFEAELQRLKVEAK